MILQELQALNLQEMADWPKPVQWGLIASLCIILLAAAYFLQIKDQRTRLSHLTGQEQTLRQQLEQQQSRAAGLPNDRAQLSAMQTAFNPMLRQLAQQTETPDLLIDVSQTGLAVGLQFLLFQPQAETRQTFYTASPVKLRMLGNYHQFGKFVSGLAALPRIVTLHDIVIRPQQANPASDLLIMQATAKTYRYRQQEPGA